MFGGGRYAQRRRGLEDKGASTKRPVPNSGRDDKIAPENDRRGWMYMRLSQRPVFGLDPMTVEEQMIGAQIDILNIAKGRVQEGKGRGGW